jgi:hypothetical protein
MGNRQLTHEFERAQGNFTLPQPTFLLFPTKDRVADWVYFANLINSSSFLTNHYNAVSTLESFQLMKIFKKFDFSPLKPLIGLMKSNPTNLTKFSMNGSVMLPSNLDQGIKKL